MLTEHTPLPPSIELARGGCRRRAHHLRARGRGDGARARYPRRGGGGLSARRLVRQAPQADGRLGRALRQDRDGRGQGGCTRAWANTAIASPKARGGRPAVAHLPPSMCLPRATPSNGTVVTVGTSWTTIIPPVTHRCRHR